MRLVSCGAALLLLLLAGCSTPPLQVVPAGSVSNRATLLYGYGPQAGFAIQSEPATVEIVRPVAAGAATDATASLRAADAQAAAAQKAAISSSQAAAAAGRYSKDEAASGTGATQAASGSASTQAAAALAQKSAAAAGSDKSEGSGLSSDSAHALGSASSAKADGDERASGASSTQASAHATATSRVRASDAATVTFAETGKSNMHQASLVALAESANLQIRSAAEDTRWLGQLPLITKSSPDLRVTVGGTVHFNIRVRNNTPIDLMRAVVTDVIDPRLELEMKRLRVTPRGSEISLRGRELTVGFPQGIPRGGSATISLIARVVDVPRRGVGN